MTGYVQTYPTEPVFSEPQYDSYIIIDHTHDLLNPQMHYSYSLKTRFLLTGH